MVDVTVVSPSVESEIQSEASGMVMRARNLVVSTAEEYVASVEFLKVVKRYQKRVRDTFGPLKKKADDAHMAICSTEAEYLHPASEAEKIVKEIGGAYLGRQRRIDAERQQAAQASALRAAEDERMRQAETLERQGRAAEAESVISAPVIVPAVSVAPSAPAVRGISTSTHWTFEIVDSAAIPREYLAVDEVRIRKIVQAMKGDTRIPGVRVYTEESVRVRA